VLPAVGPLPVGGSEIVDDGGFLNVRLRGRLRTRSIVTDAQQCPSWQPGCMQSPFLGSGAVEASPTSTFGWRRLLRWHYIQGNRGDSVDVRGYAECTKDTQPVKLS